MESNIEAFKALIRVYESIDIVQLHDIWHEMSISRSITLRGANVMHRLTKFSTNGCMLCISAPHHHCGYCIYNIVTHSDCYAGSNAKTYDGIKNARTADELFGAIQDRIIYMKSLLNKLEQ